MESVYVAARYTAQSGNLTQYLLRLQLPNQQQTTIRVDDQRIWGETSLGEELAAQVWRGGVTSVLIDGQHIQTYANPDVHLRDDLITLVASGGCLLAGAVMFLLPLVNNKCASAGFKRTIVVTSISLGIPGLLKALT